MHYGQGVYNYMGIIPEVKRGLSSHFGTLNSGSVPLAHCVCVCWHSHENYGNHYPLLGVVVPSVQVVPQGIQSVNGSDVNMGCACSLADIDDLILCGKSSDSESYNYLVDGDSPVIADWASQLVTVRKNEKNDVINFDHVVLTFGFDPAMSPTAIELDLFLCPEWKIGAPYITVYADESKDTYGLVFNYSSVQANVIDFIRHYTPNKTSCDSLSNVSISLKEHAGAFYFTWHIVVSFAPQPDIEWVHVGEVRFFGSTADPDPIQSKVCHILGK